MPPHKLEVKTEPALVVVAPMSQDDTRKLQPSSHDHNRSTQKSSSEVKRNQINHDLASQAMALGTKPVQNGEAQVWLNAETAMKADSGHDSQAVTNGTPNQLSKGKKKRNRRKRSDAKAKGKDERPIAELQNTPSKGRKRRRGKKTPSKQSDTNTAQLKQASGEQNETKEVLTKELPTKQNKVDNEKSQMTPAKQEAAKKAPLTKTPSKPSAPHKPRLEVPMKQNEAKRVHSKIMSAKQDATKQAPSTRAPDKQNAAQNPLLENTPKRCTPFSSVKQNTPKAPTLLNAVTQTRSKQEPDKSDRNNEATKKAPVNAAAAKQLKPKKVISKQSSATQKKANKTQIAKESVKQTQAEKATAKKVPATTASAALASAVQTPIKNSQVIPSQSKKSKRKRAKPKQPTTNTPKRSGAGAQHSAPKQVAEKKQHTSAAPKRKTQAVVSRASNSADRFAIEMKNALANGTASLSTGEMRNGPRLGVANGGVKKKASKKKTTITKPNSSSSGLVCVVCKSKNCTEYLYRQGLGMICMPCLRDRGKANVATRNIGIDVSTLTSGISLISKDEKPTVGSHREKISHDSKVPAVANPSVGPDRSAALRLPAAGLGTQQAPNGGENLSVSKRATRRMPINHAERSVGSSHCIRCPHMRANGAMGHDSDTTSQSPTSQSRPNEMHCNPRSRALKVSCKSQKGLRFARRFTVDPGVAFGLFEKQLRLMFSLNLPFVISYTDNEGDAVAITSDNELREMFTVMEQASISPMKLELIPITRNS